MLIFELIIAPRRRLAIISPKVTAAAFTPPLVVVVVVVVVAVVVAVVVCARILQRPFCFTRSAPPTDPSNRSSMRAFMESWVCLWSPRVGTPGNGLVSGLLRVQVYELKMLA